MNSHGIIGANYQLSELAAIVLLLQLRVLEELCIARETIMRQVDSCVAAIPGLTPIALHEGTEIRSQFRYSFVVDGADACNGLRDRLLRHAAERGIPLRIGHRAVGVDERLFALFGPASHCPVAAEMDPKVVSILHMDILERGAEWWGDHLAALARECL